MAGLDSFAKEFTFAFCTVWQAGGQSSGRAGGRFRSTETDDQCGSAASQANSFAYGSQLVGNFSPTRPDQRKEADGVVLSTIYGRLHSTLQCSCAQRAVGISGIVVVDVNEHRSWGTVRHSSTVWLGFGFCSFGRAFRTSAEPSPAYSVPPAQSQRNPRAIPA